MPIEIVGKHAFERVCKKYTHIEELRVKLCLAMFGYVWLSFGCFRCRWSIIYLSFECIELGGRIWLRRQKHYIDMTLEGSV